MAIFSQLESQKEKCIGGEAAALRLSKERNKNGEEDGEGDGWGSTQ